MEKKVMLILLVSLFSFHWLWKSIFRRLGTNQLAHPSKISARKREGRQIYSDRMNQSFKRGESKSFHFNRPLFGDGISEKSKNKLSFHNFLSVEWRGGIRFKQELKRAVKNWMCQVNSSLLRELVWERRQEVGLN